MFSRNCSCRLLKFWANVQLGADLSRRGARTQRVRGFDFSSAFITRASDALIAKFDYAKEVGLFVRFQWSVLVPHSLGPPFAKMLIIGVF